MRSAWPCSTLRPVDLLEDSAQTLSPRRIDGFNERDPASEVCSVLAAGASAGAIRNNGLQQIEVGALDVAPIVHDKTRKMLAYAPAHDARLAMIHRDALLMHDGGDVRREPFNTPFKVRAAGECQIVGISRVAGAR